MTLFLSNLIVEKFTFSLLFKLCPCRKNLINLNNLNFYYTSLNLVVYLVYYVKKLVSSDVSKINLFATQLTCDIGVNL